MEIWLDTLDAEAVAAGVKAGLVTGVTTNPSILAKTKDVKGTLNRLLDVQPGPVAAQVTAKSVEGMVEDGMQLSAFSHRIIVKVPMTPEGCRAIVQLKKENVTVLGTAILFPTQVLMATQLATSYISPYYSHMGEHGNSSDSLSVMNDMLIGSETKLLVASLRHLEDLIFCAELGVFGVTIKPDLFGRYYAHNPAVEKFLDKFEKEWGETHGNQSIMEMLKLS